MGAGSLMARHVDLDGDGNAVGEGADGRVPGRAG